MIEIKENGRIQGSQGRLEDVGKRKNTRTTGVRLPDLPARISQIHIDDSLHFTCFFFCIFQVIIEKLEEINNYWNLTLLSRRVLQVLQIVIFLRGRSRFTWMFFFAKIGCVRRQDDWHSWYLVWQCRRESAWERRHRHGNSTTFWKTWTLLNNMSLDRNVFHVILVTETENEDMTNTDDEMLNKRMGRDVQKYLYIQIQTNPSYSSQYSVNIQRGRGSMIVYWDKNNPR